MAVRIIWSALALKDLEEIGAYIRRENPVVVRAFVKALTNRIERLRNFPRLGRVVPEQEDSLVRELILKPYRLVYRYNPRAETIEVSRIWHAARGAPKMN
jgi:toxin ParE1/3/4